MTLKPHRLTQVSHAIHIYYINLSKDYNFSTVISQKAIVWYSHYTTKDKDLHAYL